jgi:hypothetical protein
MQAARLMLVDRLGAAAASRGEELLAEIPGAIRRVGLLMLVLAFAVPVFLAGCLTVLAWWLLA